MREDLQAASARELAEIRRRSGDLLAIITERQRDAMALYFGRGCSFRQVGRMLGISASSARRLFLRGLRRIRAAGKDLPGA